MNTNAFLSSARGFFTRAGLPLFLLSATIVYESFLALVIFGPEGASAWGGFTSSFKQWCFSYDPRTGGMDWAAVIVMLLEPIFISAIAVFLWRTNLKELNGFGGLRPYWRSMTSGMLVSGFVISGLFFYGSPTDEELAPLPFPGERIRVSLTPPAFRMNDQKGNTFGLEDLQGKVVLITGVYASCTTSCPQILITTKQLLDSLPPEMSEKLSVVAMSLDPEYETATLMDRVATAYGFTYPQFRYINGEPEEMYETLLRFGFSRSVNQETGEINHANLFLLLDRDGKIAYRFSLDDKHNSWLRSAVVALVEEVNSDDYVAEK